MNSNKMKASTRKKYGSPEIIHIKTIDQPLPGDNELFIKIQARTVNRTDCAILKGKPLIMRFFTGLMKPRTQITGTDFSGKIEAVGKKVTHFKVGDDVFGFNDMGLKSHAEYMILNEKDYVRQMPEKLAYKEIVACLEGFHYAYNFVNKLKIDKGQRVLINGASGAIGSALVQLCKYFEMEVTAVCGSGAVELVKSLGANDVIDYKIKDFTKTNATYDYVFDAVGKSTYGKCKNLLAPKGIYISSEPGLMMQNIFLALLTSKFGEKTVIFPIPKAIDNSMDFVKVLIQRNEFVPVIDREYTLEEISEAYEYVLSERKKGNVIISNYL